MKYLALGDSYTIGEQVPYTSNFPNQLVSALQQRNILLFLDRLIAKTGWTTDELAIALEQQTPDSDYDWVTLLIGVNNQYRKRSIDEYRWQFYSLLCQAILFAKGHAAHVIVLSIPDWGLTPFNTQENPLKVSSEIDQFNAVNREISNRMGAQYLEITELTRQYAKNTDFLAEDLLHYSARMYQLWAEQLAYIIASTS